MSDSDPVRSLTRRSLLAAGAGAAATAAVTGTALAGGRPHNPGHGHGPHHGPGHGKGHGPRPPHGAPVAKIETGALRGSCEGDVLQFLGIPYAAPPLPPLRFRSPQPAPGWKGVRDATAKPPSSLQTNPPGTSWIFQPESLLPLSEDCLYLNVWTTDLRGRRPVVFYIHGGGGRSGSGTVLGIDGTTMAGEGDVVVVTFNYRLSALGMLAHPSFADPDTGLYGNWGHQDILFALQWVKRNIAAFGGDPDNITLSGESWGAMVSRDISLQPQSAGLYAKLAGASMRLSPAQTPAQGARYTELLASRMGTDVAGLRTLPALDVHNAEVALAGDKAATGSIGAILQVIVDGVTVRYASPFNQPSTDTPMLIGTNRNEANIEYNLTAPDGTVVSPLKPPQTLEELKPAMAARFNELWPAPYPQPDLEAVRATYEAEMAARGEDNSPRFLLPEIVTDLLRRGPSSHWAAKQTAEGRNPAYLYELTSPLVPPGEGTPHTTDIPLLFGTNGAPYLAERIGDSAATNAVSKALRQAWIAFAWTSSPANRETGRWRPYSEALREVGSIGGATTFRIEEAPRKTQMDSLPVFTYSG